MRRPVTHWYTKDQPIFENTEEMLDCRIDVTRIPAGAETPPCMKISHKTYETMEKANWEFLRLSLPVTCKAQFISEHEKARRWNDIRIRQHRLMADVEAQQTPAHIDHIMKSGFTMSDIKGMSRSYGEDAAEAVEQMMRPTGSPVRPQRKCSMAHGGYDADEQGLIERSTSAYDLGDYQTSEALDEDKAAEDKKRGRSAFRFFKKSRDQSKDKSRTHSQDAKYRQKMRELWD